MTICRLNTHVSGTCFCFFTLLTQNEINKLYTWNNYDTLIKISNPQKNKSENKKKALIRNFFFFVSIL